MCQVAESTVLLMISEVVQQDLQGLHIHTQQHASLCNHVLYFITNIVSLHTSQEISWGLQLLWRSSFPEWQYIVGLVWITCKSQDIYIVDNMIQS